MKRLPLFITAMLLSVLVVMMSGGMTVVHCAHSGEWHMMSGEAMALAGQGDGDGGDCCPGKSPCMTVTSVGAQPSVMPTAVLHTFQCPVLALPPMMESLMCQVPQWGVTMPQLLGSMPFHGPPRHWLRLITVLQI